MSATGATGSADDITALEIHQWYKRFMRECPSGMLSLHEFKALLGLQGMDREANTYVEQVFNTFDMNKIYQLYSKFMKECPSGLLSLYEFKILLDLQNMDTQAETYVDRVFQTFDSNKDGFIDFLEFIAAINLVIRGKIDQKLKWYFKLYDADGNGCIDKKELSNIFKAVQAINGHTNMTPEEFTNMVFQKIDVNNDGELTLEEFVNGVESDKNLLELISKSFDLSNVLKIIQSGRRHSV